MNDGETLDIIGQKVTFFDIQSTKAKQFGFSMELDDGKVLTCCGDEPLTKMWSIMPKMQNGFCMKRFVCIHRRIFSIHTKSTIPR